MLNPLCLPSPDDTVKPQWVRLADVFFIGPLMTTGGVMLARREHPILGTLLGVLGVTTVLYNGYNYLRVRQTTGATT